MYVFIYNRTTGFCTIFSYLRRKDFLPHSVLTLFVYYKIVHRCNKHFPLPKRLVFIHI